MAFTNLKLRSHKDEINFLFTKPLVSSYVNGKKKGEEEIEGSDRNHGASEQLRMAQRKREGKKALPPNV